MDYILIRGQNKKWVRADLIKSGKVDNLYHVALNESLSLKENFVRAAEYIIDNYPKLSHLQIISDFNTQLKGGPSDDLTNT